MQLKNLTPTIGSEVQDVDLGSVDDVTLQRIKQALHERMVLVFRNQKLNRDDHKKLGTLFGTGELHRHALSGKDGQDPEILAVKSDENSKFVAGDGWHTDVSCDPNPISCSMLYITETPESGGGDTLFANMNAAYEQLSPPIKDLIANLSAVHDGSYPYKTIYGIEPPADQPYNCTTHPMVIKHPETGKPILWVNRGFTTKIPELSLFESRHMLEMLFAIIEASPSIQCRVQWEPNTLVMWDNVGTQHHAVWDYFPNRRYGERVSSVGPNISKAA